MQPTRPTKEQIRAFTSERAKSTTPPPSIEEIRRQLGWHMVQGGRR